MTSKNFKIGAKVDYITGTFMKNGTVYGFDHANNRVYVNFPNHGNCCINASNLIEVSTAKK